MLLQALFEVGGNIVVLRVTGVALSSQALTEETA